MQQTNADESSEEQIENECGETEPTPDAQRERIAERQREVGLSTRRLIDVHDGEKRSTDHTRRELDDDQLSGNYGVYGGLGADSDVIENADPNKDGPHYDGDPEAVDVLWLVDVDVDDYEDAEDGSGDEIPTDGLDSLPATLTIESPHTDGQTGGHRYYAVRGHLAKAIYERVGKQNPSPEWGEVRTCNQYVVGPGSQIEKGPNGCDKDWCDKCAKPDGGYYSIAQDRPIAEVELWEFVDAIAKDLADPQDSRTASEADTDTDTDDIDIDIDIDIDLDGFEYESNPDADIQDVIGRNEWIADYLIGIEEADDRSDKDLAICRKFVEAGVSEQAAREEMSDSKYTKVSERGRDYWERTWRAAIRKEVADGTDASWGSAVWRPIFGVQTPG